MKRNRQQQFIRAAWGLLFVCACIALPGDSGTVPEKNAPYYNKTGWEHLKTGNAHKAILAFRNALRQNPRYKEAIVGLAQGYLSTEAYDESLKLFEDAVKYDRKNSAILSGKGMALAGLGRYHEALAAFDEAVKLSEENLDAKYGLARLYYLMDKRLWAKRKLETIFRSNPFHYDSLLLAAEIKAEEKRLDEATAFVKKAVESNPELPQGYVRFGDIYLREYLKRYDDDFVVKAVEEFGRALALQPDHFAGNRYLGIVALIKGNMGEAAAHFRKCLAVNPKSVPALYGLAVALAGSGSLDEAEKQYAAALAVAPSNGIVQNGFEDFLVGSGFAMGNPSRVDLSRAHLATARDCMKKKLPVQSIYHLRRTLLLNPMDREAREALRDYYYAQDYYRFYVDEIGTLVKLYPSEKYQEALEIAVMKRRDRLYQRVGYGTEPPPRDVPSVFVLDLHPRGEMPAHYDAGRVIANAISFSLAQWGRMRPVGMKDRAETLRGIRFDDEYIEKSLERINDRAGKGALGPVDYVLYGDFREGVGFVHITLNLLNRTNGVVITSFTLSELGRNNLPEVALRAARKVYEKIPFRGRVLKMDEDKPIVNLGGFDGLKKDDIFVIYKDAPRDSHAGGIGKKMKILLTVGEADTLVSALSVERAQDLAMVDVGDAVYPLEKRRAKRLK